MYRALDTIAAAIRTPSIASTRWVPAVLALFLVAPAVLASAVLAPNDATAQDVVNASGGVGSGTDVAPPERLIALLSELADDLETAGIAADSGPDAAVDCDAVAGALDQWTDTHAAELSGLVTSVDAYLDQIPPSDVRGLETRVAPYVDAVVVAAIGCAEHDGTMAALESMETVLATGPGEQ